MIGLQIETFKLNGKKNPKNICRKNFETKNISHRVHPIFFYVNEHYKFSFRNGWSRASAADIRFLGSMVNNFDIKSYALSG